MVTDERDKESITYIIIIYWIVMYAFCRLDGIRQVLGGRQV